MGEYAAAVVGGGFFGALVACRLAAGGARVVLLEERPDLLGRASARNQARVHGGYHYPRSLLTAYRSRLNAARFAADFPDCVDRSFTAVYAVAREHSKVTAAQFELVCRRVGAPLRPAPPAVARLFDRDQIEAVWAVDEPAFDADKLRRRVRGMLLAAGVEVRTGTAARRVETAGDGLAVRGDGFAVTAKSVYNCTYSQLNRLLVRSGLGPIPLRHELAELVLVEPPPALAGVGVTVMCGPFFSCMPYPPAGLHTLSHVRYTPHGSWTESTADDCRDAAAPAGSRADRMIRDAARFVPALARVRPVRSLWEVKTVLPVNDRDDGRPILFRRDAGLPGLHCVLGAKLDNVYDVLDQLGTPGERPAGVAA